ncbi:MAG: hypothetical protein HKL85_03565 [Acidimicrobiaceae bacterium]|nr:hypothetical protein [Acidimicrobiaceae bacterium]
MHSFDATRDRRAPRYFQGTTLEGELVQGNFTSITLVVAVKEDCLGCQSVLEAPEGAFGDVATMMLAARASSEPFWKTSKHRVLISESLLQELDVRWPPFYVLIDPSSEKIVREGVVFAPEQVREEIAPYLM